MEKALRDLERLWQSSGTEEDLQNYARALQRSGVLCETPGEIPSILDDYNWEESFKYASSPTLAVPPTHEDYQKPQPGFTRKDIKHVISMAYGENDGDDWILVVQLWDGRFAFLEAGCDYTGWG